MQITTVKQLEFSDLYVGHPFLEDRFSDVPGAASNPLKADPELKQDLAGLTALCQSEWRLQPLRGEFKIDYDGVAYRTSVMKTVDGEVFVLRKIAPEIPLLAALGIPQAYIRCLLSKNMSGLFIFSGAIKSGKTTSACATVKERLTAYGGVAVSIEETIELPLEGNHGSGVCYQTSLSRENHSAVEIFRRALRWGARTILIDEIRDHEVAAEALQASLNGQLIIATMVANNVVQTINKLHNMANESMAPGAAQALLADGLLGVMSQNFDTGKQRKLETEFLFLQHAEASKNILRSGRYELLMPEIKKQMIGMILENASALRHMEA